MSPEDPEESPVQETSRDRGDAVSEAPEAPPAGQALGQVERTPADQFQGRRRLLLVPLMFAPPAQTGSEESDGQTIYERYWGQARTQIDALASGLGGLHRIYHESLIEGGEAGLSYLEMADPHAYQLIQVRCQAGALLEATESIDLITETIDLQRCLMIPFTSESVATRIQEWHSEANRSRYDYIARQIDQTLQADETGLLLINERHQVQFSADIEVFYVAPPALDEYRRWVQNWAEGRERVVEEGGTQGEESQNSEAE